MSLVFGYDIVQQLGQRLRLKGIKRLVAVTQWTSLMDPRKTIKIPVVRKVEVFPGVFVAS